MKLVLPIFAAIAAVLLALSFSVTTALADAPETRAGEWVDGARVFSTDASQTGQAAIYTSEIQKADFFFNALAANWKTKSGAPLPANIEVRASFDGVNWSEWYPVPRDDDSRDGEDGAFSALVALTTSRYFQYRLVPLNETAAMSELASIRWIYIDSMDGPQYPGTQSVLFEDGSREDGGVPPEGTGPDSSAQEQAQPAAGSNSLVSIISRKGWGADESYRFDSEGKEKWPKKYKQAKKVVIHHTVTGNREANPAATVRSIYYYHAITRGWGDIGYNYLVDWKGNVYEGRAGGANVIGGHASAFNPGSIGIAVTGDYMTADITPQSEDSLVRLIASVGNGIDPEGHGWFIDGDYPNIIGHRDVSSTACPGDYLYKRIPGIRKQVGGTVTFALDASAEIKSVTFEQQTVALGKFLKVNVTVKNTGDKPLGTQGPNPGYVYQEGQSFQTLGFAKTQYMVRVAMDFTDNKGVSHPYRWGLGAPLGPGEERTITGYVQLNNPHLKEYWVGLVQEYVKYVDDGKGKTVINAIPLPTAPVEPIDDPNILYFPETKHNLGYGFRTYWEENGGLMQFGYPKTEEFTEISPTDGKLYTVQYFERARFEYHPEHQGTAYEVQLGLLSNQLQANRQFEISPPFTSTSDRTYFPETKHSLNFGFKYYWENYGALPVYGFPISEEISEKNQADGNTYTVQYFERNRFEYHPEYKGTKYEVLLGLLGNEALRKMGWID